MHELARDQDCFASALLDPALPVPSMITGAKGSPSLRRFAVYRNNVIAGLVAALAARYPVVHRLVGEELFADMARDYVRRQPPRSPVLALYGDTFPAFIETFAPAASVEYLADVARLELARGRAYHAADVAPVAADAFATIDPTLLGALQTVLHPSVSVVSSRFPIVSIWEAHQSEELKPVTRWSSEAALVVRPVLDVDVWRLPSGGAAFLHSLAGGATLTAAVEAGAATVEDFDATVNLAVLIGARAVVGLGRAPSLD